jgi:hypothetical protein
MALFFGYDPGGDGAHGAAQIEVELPSGRVLGTDVLLSETADDVLNYFGGAMRSQRIAGIGVDTLTEWCLGSAGWRPADRWLRAKYPKVAKSVASANSISGSMCLNGVGVLHALREHDPSLLITETHPKVLHFALTGAKYDWDSSRAQMIGWVRSQLGHDTPALASDHEFDALVSAWACAKGVLGHWTRDLHALDGVAEKNGTVVRPAGRTRYFWP